MIRTKEKCINAQTTETENEEQKVEILFLMKKSLVLFVFLLKLLYFRNIKL